MADFSSLEKLIEATTKPADLTNVELADNLLSTEVRSFRRSAKDAGKYAEITEEDAFRLVRKEDVHEKVKDIFENVKEVKDDLAEATTASGKARYEASLKKHQDALKKNAKGLFQEMETAEAKHAKVVDLLRDGGPTEQLIEQIDEKVNAQIKNVESWASSVEKKTTYTVTKGEVKVGTFKKIKLADIGIEAEGTITGEQLLNGLREYKGNLKDNMATAKQAVKNYVRDIRENHEAIVSEIKELRSGMEKEIGMTADEVLGKLSGKAASEAADKAVGTASTHTAQELEQAAKWTTKNYVGAGLLAAGVLDGARRATSQDPEVSGSTFGWVTDVGLGVAGTVMMLAKNGGSKAAQMLESAHINPAKILR